MPDDEAKKEEGNEKKKESEDNNGDGKEKKGFPSWLKWVLIVLAGVLVAASAFALTKFVIMPKYLDKKVETVLDNKQKEQKKSKDEIGEIYKLKGITVNAKGSKGRRYIVAELAFDISSEDVLEEVKKREPQIINDIISFFRGQTVEQATAVSFMKTSKNTLVNLVNKRLKLGEIDKIYYTQFIIQ